MNNSIGKYVTLAGLFILCSIRINAQHKSGLTLKERVDRLNELAVELAKTSPENAMIFGDSAKILARQIDYAEGIANANLNLGNAHTNADRYDTAFYFLRAAQQQFAKLRMTERIAKVDNQMGLTFQHNGVYDSAVSYFNKALDLYTSIREQQGIASACNNLGNTYMFKGQNKLALQYLERALALRRKIGNADTTSSFMNLGIVQMQLGNFPASLNLYLTALNTFSALKDSFNIIQVHSNLGILYQKMLEYDKAEASFELALAYQEKMGFKLSANKTHNNLGQLFFSENRAEEGFEHFHKSLDILQEIKSDQDLWTPLLNIGYYHRELGNYDKAIEYLTQAFISSEKTKSREGKCLTTIHLALTYKDLNDFDKATYYSEKSLEFADVGIPPSTKEYILYSIHEIYDAKGNSKKALEYFKEYTALKDSVLNEHKLNQLIELQTLYGLNLKEKEIEQLQLKSEQADLRSNVLWVSLVLVLLLSGLTVLLFRSRLKIQNANNRVLEANASVLANQILLKSELLEELKQKMEQLKSAGTKASKSQFFNIIRLLETSIKFEDDWSTFSKTLKEVDPSFFDRLGKEFPDLTNSEIRLIALIRLRLTNKEISNIIHVEPNSVKQSRYRLKKKLGLALNHDLAKFIYEF
ncbi:MAG: tetratricopeptide repeat protein [Flavobacteriales bacterium]|nr:tetratricopeptide repeat protein [Flavobacteriales bacterium]